MNAPAHVYFIQVMPNGPIKIGFTTGNVYCRVELSQQEHGVAIMTLSTALTILGIWTLVSIPFGIIVGKAAKGN